MWLIIRDSDSVVTGTNYNFSPPVPAGHTAKEWHGPEPRVGELDPTLDDPDYTILVQSRVDFGELANLADAEIEWLETTIPQIDDMAFGDLRTVLLRLARENLRQIKAWRYLFRKLG